MKAVEVRNLTFSYRNQRDKVLDHVNLAFEKGKITIITGKSGSGKSTLCYCLCGLIPSSIKGEFSGEVLLLNRKLNELTVLERTQTIGIVFQNPATQLFSPTIEDELAFGPENLKIDREVIEKRITDILKRLGMERYRYENPNHLSGGEQQLIAIGSVLMVEPEILVCDEIFSFMDAEHIKEMKKLIIELKNEGRTIILVNHDQEHMDIADEIIRM